MIAFVGWVERDRCNTRIFRYEFVELIGFKVCLCVGICNVFGGPEDSKALGFAAFNLPKVYFKNFECEIPIVTDWVYPLYPTYNNLWVIVSLVRGRIKSTNRRWILDSRRYVPPSGATYKDLSIVCLPARPLKRFIAVWMPQEISVSTASAAR